MTRREIWDTVYGAAAAAYEPREARAVAALVCEDRLGLRFTDVIVEPDAPCPLRDDLQRLAFEIGSYRPAQYIAGFCRFCGRKFSLEEGVLIPRPETEELVRTIVERHRSDSGLRILDIGTGSGCIAVTLAAEPHRALFVPDDDPLLFYRAIAGLGRRLFAPGGTVYFEINERFGTQTVELLENEGYREIVLSKDFFGKPRTVSARWK